MAMGCNFPRPVWREQISRQRQIVGRAKVEALAYRLSTSLAVITISKRSVRHAQI
jgi:hypothetical protein